MNNLLIVSKRLFFVYLLLVINTKVFSQRIPVSFVSDNYLLIGELSLPNDIKTCPLVVFVHGSGPLDKDQTIILSDPNSKCLFPNLYGDTIRTFHDISEHLNANGIATMRYDKRTYTHRNNINSKTISPYDFVTDLSKALECSLEKSPVNFNSIFLLGHSQGADLLPFVNSKVDGYISLAGSTNPLDSILGEQFRNVYTKCLKNEFGGNFVAGQIYEHLNRIRENKADLSGEFNLIFPDQLRTRSMGSNKFWFDWVEIVDSSFERYNKSLVPSLFIYGNKDPNFNKKRLENNQNIKSATFYVDYESNHFLTLDNSSTVSSTILEIIQNWIIIITITKHFSTKNIQLF